MAAFGIVGDAVQNSLGVGSFADRQEVAEIQRSKHMSRLQRDTYDAVGVPDVGVDLTTDTLQLIY